MRFAILAAAAAVPLMLLAVPASAQSLEGDISSLPSEMFNSGPMGSAAITPSRMSSTRLEMNRGREPRWHSNMTGSQRKTYAERTLARAGYRCHVVDTAFIAQLSDGTPLVEVSCRGGGGLIIANTSPIQATDCMDLPLQGDSRGGAGRIESCQLPSTRQSSTDTDYSDDDRN